MSTTSKIKVRFAPSPTGFLHVGGLRTALYNYLFAKQNNGEFILRIEDTDQSRLVQGAEQNIIDTLKIFGLKHEPPVKQSNRLSVYKNHANELVVKELAYMDEGAIRFKMPKTGITAFTDIIRGKIQIENKLQEDFIILKSDGYPTYNLAHLVDDHDMAVTHVIRGEEFIPSMPKYIALHKAFGWEPPQYAHLPLLLNKNRAKLSKREGDVAVKDFLEKGYLKEAMLNFVALLGWHPSKSEQEIFSLDDLVKEFKLDHVQKAGAIFDLEKLNWLQHQWILKLNTGSPKDHPLFEKVKPKLQHEGLAAALWPHVLERLKSPEDLENLDKEFSYFLREPEYESDMLVWKKSNKEQTKQALEKFSEFLSAHPDWQKEKLEEEAKKFIKEAGLDNGTVLWPVRVALTGKDKSMGPFEILEIFAKDNIKQMALDRLKKAVGKLS